MNKEAGVGVLVNVKRSDDDKSGDGSSDGNDAGTSSRE
jgi:hypothetical protein